MEIKNLGKENRGSFGIMTKYCIDGKMHCSEFFAKGILGRCITLTHFRSCDGSCEGGVILDESAIDYGKKRIFKEMISKVEALNEAERNKYIEATFERGGYPGRYREDF